MLSPLRVRSSALLMTVALLLSSAQAFSYSSSSCSNSRRRTIATTVARTTLPTARTTRNVDHRDVSRWAADPESDFGPTTITTPTMPPAAATTTAMPETYAQCGRCQSSFALTEADLGTNARGRRLECSVCGHSWFQSKDRLLTLNDGYALVPLPQMDLDRIATNLKEGKSPKYTGDSKLYVGNISFDSTEDDLMGLFSSVGELGSVSLVRDPMGRNRGFGFVTMRTKEDGLAAIEQLNGKEFKGRTIAVRESNN